MENENTNLHNYEYNGESLNERVESSVNMPMQFIQGPDGSSNMPGYRKMDYRLSYLAIILLIILLIINIIRKDRKKVIFGIVSCILLYFSRIGVSAYIPKTIIRYAIIVTIIGIISIIYCLPKKRKD